MLASQSRGERLDDDVAEVRKRFDIFYSRMDTFRSTGTYAILRETPDFVKDFDQTTESLQQIDAMIEGLKAGIRSESASANPA